MSGTAPTSQKENYPSYDALWHLKTMGVLDHENAPVGWSATPKDKPTRIAIIDTSVAVAHPSLQATINTELSLDLFSARLGAFPYLAPEQTAIGALDLN